MKRITAIILTIVLCACVFGACSNKSAKKDSASEKLQPTESVNAEKLQSDEDFVGNFKNSDYTAHIEKNEDGEMVVTIKSAEQKIEWTMSGYFGYETYRINYDNAVKKGKETEYKNGSGRIQFSDSDKFKWENGMEIIENNEFTRV